MKILKVLAIIILVAFAAAMAISCKQERTIQDVSNELHRNVIELDKAKTQREMDSICKIHDSLSKEYDEFFYKKGEPVDITK